MSAYRDHIESLGLLKSCCRCGYENAEALEVHHKDRNRSNNEIDNLEVLCCNCHRLEHRANPRPRKKRLKPPKRLVCFRISDALAECLAVRCSMRGQSMRGQSKTDVLMEAIERGWEEPAQTQRKTMVASQSEHRANVNIPGVFWGSELETRHAAEDETGVETAPVMCSYSEWSGELGETVYCGLPQHSAKTKHGRWRNTTPVA